MYGKSEVMCRWLLLLLKFMFRSIIYPTKAYQYCDLYEKLCNYFKCLPYSIYFLHTLLYQIHYMHYANAYLYL